MKTLSRNLLRTFLIISLSFCCQVDRSGAGVPPSADFFATPPVWSVPAAVSFTDSSSGNVTSWLWNFGDGTQSNLINPLHVYSTPGKYTVSLTVTSPDGTGSKVKADYVSVEEHVPVATEYLVRVDPTSHRKFGLYYPVTYKFRLPAGARDLAAQYRYWEGSWNPLPERQRTDNFNGVDAVRFDYTGGLAYLSVRLSRWSDSLYLRIVDSSGEPVAVVFDSIPKYYDERKAAVVLTLDDWDGSGDAAFRAAADLLASENLPFTVGLITASTPWASVQEKADQLGDHMEIASHSIYHSCSATEYGTRGYQTEVAGSRELIRSNLTFSSHPYVPAYVEPCGYSDDNLKSAVTAGDYLVTRSSNDNPASGAVFADWDAAQGRYGRGAVSYTDIRDYTDAVQLANANNLFNDALAGGTIYHLMDHPWKGYWYPNSWLMQHLDYIKGRSEIWYVPYGQLYQYHFLQEMRGSLTIQPLNPASVVASLAAAPLSGTVPLSVAFTDTSSGTITSWLWDFGDGASSTVQHPVHVYSAAGAYNVKLTVSGPGGSDLRAVTGMIRAVAPTPTTVSITSPAANATYSAPAAISITAAATAGTGTTVRQVDFYSGTTLIGTATSSPYGVTWSNVPAGNYTLTASVTDSAGSLKWSAPVAVSVMANPLPTVTITEPASGTSYLAPAEIAVSPLVTAGTGATVTRVEYYADSQLVASSSTSPFRAAWSNVAPGGYTLTARVTDSNGGSATSAPVLVSVIDNTLPAPWATRDVGSVGLAGSARSLDGNTFTLAGSGADIWGSADAFRFVYRPLAGDGSIVAKVVSLQNTNPYAKAGVMMRETLAANSVHAMMDLTPTTGAEFSRRVATGGTTAATVMASLAAPYWVKLSRSGNTFTGYVSSDGLTWTQAGSSSITMANTIYVGLVVTSHYNTTLCTASFDYLDLMGTSIVPPAAILTAPESGATFSAPASLLVTATASAGTGAALKQVDFYADGVQIGTATAAPYAMNWNNVAAGSYSLTAMVTDSLGGTATSSPATITVTANLPPTVSITAPADGASYTAPAGIAVTATATAGGGASIVQVDFYADGTLLGTARTAPFSVFWNNVAAGSYSLRAQVTDSLGAFASSPPVGVTVVSYSAPTVTISSPSSGASFTAPATVPITVATTAGTGATIKQVEFYADGNVIGTSTVSPFGYTWSNVAEGSYQVTAKVTDSLGASATSQAVALQVTSLPTTAPPSVTISAPLSGASYLAPATIAITATATAGTGGTVSRVDFYADGMQIGTATAAPYTVSFSSVAVGSYSLTAKVTDSLGASATSSAVTVTVNPYVPPAATISSPANGASYLAPASIPISATASPGSGATISKVEFFSNGTPIGAATTTPYTVTWGGVAAGSYSLTAKVTDSLGVSGTSPQVSVTVNPYLAPTVVITAPPEGASFTAPAAITMAASATAGSGAVIQKVEYLANNVLVASATTAPFSATWNKAAAGSYLLTAKVTDSLGATAVSAAVTVTVVNGPADLVISKNHKGNVRAGQAASYQITVSNSGTGPSTGSVTVRDLLPTQLVATGIKGTGWTCTLSTLTCTRSDALAAGAKYPVITVTANVPKVPTTVTNTATVSGGGELNTSNDTATDVTVIR